MNLPQAAMRQRFVVTQLIASLQTAAVGGLVIALYQPLFVWLYQRWQEDGNYAHAPLVPLVSAYLLWSQRAELATVQRRPARLGLLVVGVAALAQLASLWADVYFASGWSFILLLLGLTLVGGGRPLLRSTFFPLAFLFFAVPLSRLLLEFCSLPLQLLSAKCAAGLADLVAHLGVTRDGTILHIGKDFTFVVGTPCSGLKSLISMTALAALVAHWTPTVAWKKWLIFAASVPVAVAANVGRLFILLCIGRLYGQKAAEGFFHSLSGMVTFLLSLLLFGVVVGLMLARRERPVTESGNGREQQGMTSRSQPFPVVPSSPLLPRSRWSSFSLCVIGAVVLAADLIAYGVILPARHPLGVVNLSSLPLRLGDWEGADVEAPTALRDVLGAEQVVRRQYRKKIVTGREPSPPVEVIVVVGRDRRAVHAPALCYAGAGYSILRQEPIAVAGTTEVPATEWRRLLASAPDGQHLLVLFTYTNGALTTPSWLRQQFYAAWQHLRRDRQPWAQVQLVVGVEGEEEAAWRAGEQFLRAAWTPLMRRLRRSPQQARAQ